MCVCERENVFVVCVCMITCNLFKFLCGYLFLDVSEYDITV